MRRQSSRPPAAARRSSRRRSGPPPVASRESRAVRRPLGCPCTGGRPHRRPSDLASGKLQLEVGCRRAPGDPNCVPGAAERFQLPDVEIKAAELRQISRRSTPCRAPLRRGAGAPRSTRRGPARQVCLEPGAGTLGRRQRAGARLGSQRDSTRSHSTPGARLPPSCKNLQVAAVAYRQQFAVGIGRQSAGERRARARRPLAVCRSEAAGRSPSPSSSCRRSTSRPTLR